MIEKISPKKNFLISGLKKILLAKQAGILIPCILIIIIVSIIKPVFFSGNNFSSIARSISIIGILAVGETIVLICGEFDVSVGSIAGMIGVITAKIAMGMDGVVIPIIIGLIVAVLVGLINAFLVVKLKIMAFIATIGMMYIARGVAYVVSKGYPLYPLPKGFESIGFYRALGVSVPFIIVLILIILFEFLLRYTAYGKNMYAVGTDANVAKLLGIKSDRVKMSAFVLSGLFSGIAGIALAAHLKGGQSTIGVGWELQAIAGAAIGGISLKGGSGTIINTAIGLLIVGMLNNAVVIVGINSLWQSVVIGVLMIAAVYIDQTRSQALRIR